MRAVWPRDASVAFTLAPWARSASTASARPVRDATISGDTPVEEAAFGAGLQQVRDDDAVAIGTGQKERRDAQIVRGAHIRAGADQQIRYVSIGPGDRPVQHGRAVALRRATAGGPGVRPPAPIGPVTSCGPNVGLR